MSTCWIGRQRSLSGEYSERRKKYAHIYWGCSHMKAHESFNQKCKRTRIRNLWHGDYTVQLHNRYAQASTATTHTRQHNSCKIHAAHSLSLKNDNGCVVYVLSVCACVCLCTVWDARQANTWTSEHDCMQELQQHQITNESNSNGMEQDTEKKSKKKPRHETKRKKNIMNNTSPN